MTHCRYGHGPIVANCKDEKFDETSHAHGRWGTIPEHSLITSLNPLPPFFFCCRVHIAKALTPVTLHWAVTVGMVGPWLSRPRGVCPTALLLVAMLAGGTTLPDGGSGASHARLAFSAAAPTVPCALVHGRGVSGRLPTLLAAFCAPGGLGRACTGCREDGGLARVGAGRGLAVCTNATSRRWWQVALDWAATASHRAHRVLASPGTISLPSALPAWQPLGTTTGVHVPSGIHFGGLCPDEPTAIVPLPSAANATARLWSLLLVAGPATGQPPDWPYPAVNVTLSNLVLGGVAEADVPGWRSCNPADAARGLAPSSVPAALMRVERGIFLP